MRFALSAPWWTATLLAAAALLLAWLAYARHDVPLTRTRRAVLAALRGAALLLVAACVLRPVAVLPPAPVAGLPVPVLVDASRSMRIADARGRARAEAAQDLVARQIGPALQGRFRPEVQTFGGKSASDLGAALRDVRERYRDARIPGIVLISDGADTGDRDAAALDTGGVPVFTIGVGDRAGSRDLEVLDVTAGDARLADASLDLTISAISRAGTEPFEVRILENGRPIDVLEVAAAVAGAPVRLTVTVAPPPGAATLYTVEIPAARGEPVVENNRRSVIVEAPGRPRRILIVEGAPGFEHSFVKRALAQDEGLEVDSIVRKGRDARGQATYFVLAAEERAPKLTTGFPADRETLFAYDALILANLEHDAVAPAQLEMAAAFVTERGGGLLVLGARSFGPRGLAGTPIESVLPMGLREIGSGVIRASTAGAGRHITVTEDGETHPVMRVSRSVDDSAKRWSVVPALASAATLGDLRAGAQVLALAESGRGSRPLVAVQRYGPGRSMVFTGEASWRWRMQLPAADRTFELFWRQAARWLASAAPDPVAVAPPANVGVGSAVRLAADVRDAAFVPATDASVSMHVVMPDGSVRDVAAPVADSAAGRFTGTFQFDRPGVYRVQTDARRAGSSLGSAERWVLVGGVDAEMADPRLHDDLLRRISRSTGGEYLSSAEVSRLGSLLSAGEPPQGTPRVQEIWQTPWAFAAIALALSLEWILRRRWGLR